MLLETLRILPVTYYLAVIVLAALSGEAILRLGTGLRTILLAIYGTIGFWYLAEIVMHPEDYAFFPPGVLSETFMQVAVFLIVCRLLISFTCRKHQTSKIVERPGASPGAVLMVLLAVWLILTSIGVLRMKGDVLAALFPVGSRASEQGSMWGREGIGGPLDFLVSFASYLHLFVCSMFGLLLLYERQPSRRVTLVLLILVSWPYFFFLGARNQLLAVSTPLLVGYVLHSRQHQMLKLFVLMAAVIALQFAMLAILDYRSVGFQEFIATDLVQPDAEESTRHLGMNMGQELSYINYFHENGSLDFSWGRGYLAEAANVVPRALWPSKPAIGYEYAILRGFGNDQTLGVWATVSTGLIGQGVTNFGPLLGPVAAALLVSIYAAMLHRWWLQRAALLRFALFLLGVGIIFNLGRDFTLLVLWPVIFGYIFVRLFEAFAVSFRREMVAKYGGSVQPA